MSKTIYIYIPTLEYRGRDYIVKYQTSVNRPDTDSRPDDTRSGPSRNRHKSSSSPEHGLYTLLQINSAGKTTIDAFKCAEGFEGVSRCTTILRQYSTLRFGTKSFLR